MPAVQECYCTEDCFCELGDSEGYTDVYYEGDEPLYFIETDEDPHIFRIDQETDDGWGYVEVPKSFYIRFPHPQGRTYSRTHHRPVILATP